MQTLAEIREMLQSRGLRPKRSLGQNFLIDQNLIRKLVDAAGVGPGDVVLEVGPGTGTLTEELLDRGCGVVACELDDALAELLGERLADRIERGNLRIVHGDCLERRPRGGGLALASAVRAALGAAGGGARFSLVANLPYGAATPLISELLVGHPACGLIAVTVQREAADRLLGEPGTKSYGPMSVIAGALADGRRIAALPPACFWPRPDVESAMVVLRRSESPLTRDARGLSDACTALFAHRRKQLGGVLKGFSGWPAGIEPTMRAEQLSPRQVVTLGRAMGLIREE